MRPLSDPSTHIKRRVFVRNSAMVAAGATCMPLVSGLAHGYQISQAPDIRHVPVAFRRNYFYGWPANNGLWSWDDGQEILVGYTFGKWVQSDVHNIAEPYMSGLARSIDGGRTWKMEDPDNFVGDGGMPTPCPGNINFGHPDFALRVIATGYHGNDDPKGGFYYSYDRGRSWQGPHRFNGMNDDEENLGGMEITSRTRYLVTGPKSALIIMTARKPEIEHGRRRDKPFILETVDGGRSFRFISWIVPWTDDYRAVLPSFVRTPDGKIITALRRRNPFDINQPCWIDTYVSDDNGRHWSFLSKVTETGIHNGNPGALTLLKDGRLACCYAHRIDEKIYVRFSDDLGKSWGEPLAIRQNPLSYDLGYPQLLQNPAGQLVALYYIATTERKQSYIEAAIWQP